MESTDWHARRWPDLALVVGYWVIRLHRLTAYPIFDDEAIHIRQAKMVWKLLPFSGADDGRVLNILLYALFWPFGAGALWVSRAAYLLAGVVGFAALVALGRLAFGGTAGRWAGFIFILLPFAFFFGRIALADTLGLPMVTVLALASPRAVRRRDVWAVAVGGLALAGAILSKLNNLVFLVVPLLGLLLFRQPGRWQQPLRGIAALYVAAAFVLAPVALFLVYRAHSTLGFANVAARTGAVPFGERVGAQAATLAGYLGNYLPWLMAALAAAGLALRRQTRATWYVLALAAVPLLFFVAGANSLESRYVVPVAGALALLAGAGAEAILSRTSGPIPFLAPALLAAAIVGTGPSQFLWAGWFAPDGLALPAADRPDYIEGWPAGFGVEQASRMVLDRLAREPVTVVVTEGWHIAGLTARYGWEDNLHGVYDFSEPQLRIAWLQSGCDPFVEIGHPAGAVLFVTEHYRYSATNDCLKAAKTLIGSFPKPGSVSVIEVYELHPLP